MYRFDHFQNLLKYGQVFCILLKTKRDLTFPCLLLPEVSPLGVDELKRQLALVDQFLYIMSK